MSKNVQNSFRKILSSRITREEAQATPEINQALENDKIMRLDFLSSTKPTLIDTTGFKNGKRKNMIEDMNTFKKIYYKDYMINKHSLEKIYKISNENNIFLNHFTGFNKYYNNENQKEILNKIQLEYKKKTGFVPIIKDNGNLFSNSILLQNDKDLKQYISLDLDTIKKDANSLKFLRNVQRKIKLTGPQINKNIEKFGNKEIVDFKDEENEEKEEKDNKKFKLVKIDKNKVETIDDLQKEIIKTKESFNSIDDLNFFLNTNNQQYFSYMGGKLNSRKSSGQASTRINSGVRQFTDIKFINDDSNNIYKNIGRKIAASNTADEFGIQNSELKVKSKNYNSIILPSITNNKVMNKSNIENNERKKTIDYIKINEPNYSAIKTEVNQANQSINNESKNSSSITKKRLKARRKNRLSLKKQPTPLENLYEKLSKSDNAIEYNKEIKYFLKKNNYKYADKINDQDLYKSVDKSRKKVTDASSLQKNYDLMVDNKLKSLEQNRQMNRHNNKIKKSFEDIEERMIGLLCHMNRYGDN